MKGRGYIAAIYCACIASLLAICAAQYYGLLSSKSVPADSKTTINVQEIMKDIDPTTETSSSFNFETLTTWDTDTMNLIKILSFEEGFSSKPYLCSEGYVTIGLGTKLHKSLNMNPSDFPISVSMNMAEEWLHSEVALKDMKLSRRDINGYAYVYDALDDDKRAIILSMAYQMGTSGVLRFKKMWAALAIGDDKEAAAQALDSRWATQTPERAERHARVLRGESLVDVYSD